MERIHSPLITTRYGPASTATATGLSKLRDPCITTLNQYQITLDLLQFIDFNVKKPSDSSCSGAASFIALLTAQLENTELLYQPFWLQYKIHLIKQKGERQFVMEILACSLDCKIVWMMKQMTFNQTLAKKVQRSLDSQNFDLWSLLGVLLVSLGFARESDLDSLSDQEKKSLLQYVYFIVFDNPLDMGGLCPSYGNAETEAQRENRHAVQQCVWFDMRSSSKALIDLSYGFTRPHLVAMPVALSGTACVTPRRIWFLQRSNESDRQTCAIVEKYRMLALQPMEANVMKVIRRNDK